ncbi:MAG: PucC family protein [Proteobacteria bacterium]|nr:PucC family protein [Pseudomonadota bacterium]
MTDPAPSPPLRPLEILRLGLVQTAIGAMVVLATSTLNRVMVVEFALPASVPGALVAWHYLVQFLRPRFGHGSDQRGRLGRWIAAGLVVLALGLVGAAASVAALATQPGLARLGCVVGYALIGLGAGAAGTALLTLLARRAAPTQRAGAATAMWILMIVGFAVTSGIAGHYLDPFTPARLLAVTATAAAIALVVALVALGRLGRIAAAAAAAGPAGDFRRALATEWADPAVARFTLFVFVSMLAYAAEELVLEPSAGLVFGLSPGASARLSGTLHGGAALGMVGVGLAGWLLAQRRAGVLRFFAVSGCVGSAVLLAVLAVLAATGAASLLRPAVLLLGLANGVFAVAAIGAMMELAGDGAGRAGVRMGLWGAAQAVAFAAGGIAGSAVADIARGLLGSPAAAYATVFGAEALLFLCAARLAARVVAAASRELELPVATPAGRASG